MMIVIVLSTTVLKLKLKKEILFEIKWVAATTDTTPPTATTDTTPTTIKCSLKSVLDNKFIRSRN